jgi:2-succinyl-6-hydroxy-2,4-cyclohexadiene-1-carboxylate synthase
VRFGAGEPITSGSDERRVPTAGGAAALRLLHGFTGAAASWPPSVVNGLVAAGFDVAAPDLPGHGARRGEADAEEFTLEAALSLVELPPEGGALIGYSMGGRIALHYALRRPDRVRWLVLESASPGLATDAEREVRRTADEGLARRLEAEGIAPFVHDWERLPLFDTQRSLGEDERARVRASRLSNHPASLAAALRALGTGALPSVWEALPRLRAPTLLLVGALDEKFVAIARRMAERLPDAHLVVVPDAGHAVHLERPDAWLEAVVGFIGSDR